MIACYRCGAAVAEAFEHPPGMLLTADEAKRYGWSTPPEASR